MCKSAIRHSISVCVLPWTANHLHERKHRCLVQRIEQLLIVCKDFCESFSSACSSTCLAAVNHTANLSGKQTRVFDHRWHKSRQVRSVRCVMLATGGEYSVRHPSYLLDKLRRISPRSISIKLFLQLHQLLSQLKHYIQHSLLLQQRLEAGHSISSTCNGIWVLWIDKTRMMEVESIKVTDRSLCEVIRDSQGMQVRTVWL